MLTLETVNEAAAMLDQGVSRCDVAAKLGICLVSVEAVAEGWHPRLRGNVAVAPKPEPTPKRRCRSNPRQRPKRQPAYLPSEDEIRKQAALLRSLRT